MAGHHAFSHYIYIYIYIDIDWIPNIPNFCPQKKARRRRKASNCRCKEFKKMMKCKSIFHRVQKNEHHSHKLAFR